MILDKIEYARIFNHSCQYSETDRRRRHRSLFLIPRISTLVCQVHSWCIWRSRRSLPYIQKRYLFLSSRDIFCMQNIRVGWLKWDIYLITWCMDHKRCSSSPVPRDGKFLYLPSRHWAWEWEERHFQSNPFCGKCAIDGFLESKVGAWSWFDWCDICSKPTKCAHLPPHSLSHPIPQPC